MYTEIFELVNEYLGLDKNIIEKNPILKRPRLELKSGDKFGSRTVIDILPNRINGHIMVEVQCECGKIDVIQKSYLIHQGRPCVECGMKNYDRTGKNNPFFKHGASARIGNKRCKVYGVWVAMRQRCNDFNDKQYKDYGGRGITVCEEWNDFQRFKEDMGPRPYGYQLDRIDNNGSYCKENCRWVCSKVQNNNKRSNRVHEIDGEKILHTQLLSAIGYTRDRFRKMEENKNRGLEEAYNAYRQSKSA